MIWWGGIQIWGKLARTGTASSDWSPTISGLGGYSTSTALQAGHEASTNLMIGSKLVTISTALQMTTAGYA